MSPISEDELRARLRRVEPSPAQSGFAEHVIDQGRFRRRRQRWLTGIAAAATVVAIGGGAFAVSDQLGPETALPATPTPTPTQPEITPTVTSTRSPSATASPSRTTTPSTRTTGASSTPSPSSTPSRSVTLKPVTLLHDDSSSWEATKELPGVCDAEGVDGTALAAQHGAAETRAIRWVTEGDGKVEALIVFPSANRAVAYMADLRQRARACESASAGMQRAMVEPLEGPWGEGIAVGQWARVVGPPEAVYMGASVNLAVRHGRAVTLSTVGSHGLYEGSVDQGLVGQARPAVEHVAPQLCRYTEAGC